MKFYFCKDTSTVNSRFVIYDELGHVKYYVLRDYSHSYWNLVITDISFNKLCTINSVPLPFMKAFTIKNNESTIRLVLTKISLDLCAIITVSVGEFVVIFLAKILKLEIQTTQFS